MRVLAIRGRNIASLAAAFDVDFSREPLSSAGLFAICGRTGSGKSTLLDALCLALYDTTPRLSRAVAGRGAVLPDVGDQTISPHDPRNMLRRGAGEGHVEVDFTGNDDVEYRARWSVRRARGRQDGRLQATEMSLTRISDGLGIGALKTEVLAAIEERVGLDFGQFTRAVLLAQNEFNAFLNADDNTRAELLELLTGTGMYSDISRRAFERGRAESQALEELRRRVAGERPLDADARSALEVEVATAATAVAELEVEAQALDAQLRWHADLSAARGEERQAQDARASAVRNRSDADSRFRQLALIDVVQQAGQLLAEHDRTAAELRESREQSVPVAERLAGQTEVEVREAEAALSRARDALAAAEEAGRHAAPDLDAAKALDAEIGTLVPRHREAIERLEEITRARDTAQARLERVRTERDTRTTERQEHGEWLDDHANRGRLADEWPKWDALLAQAARSEEDAGTARRAVADAEEAEASVRQRLDVAARALEEARNSRDASKVTFEEADKTLAALDVASLVEDRKQAEARRDVLRDGQRLEATLQSLRTREAALQDEATREGDKVDHADRKVREIEANRPAAEAAWQQAQRAYEEVHLASAARVEKLRAGLEPGRPCPVCGATDHPYAAPGHEPFDQSLSVLRQQKEQHRLAVEALAGEDIEQRTIAGQAKTRKAEIERELGAVQAQQSEASRAWEVHVTATETARLPDGERADWFAVEILSVARHLEAVSAREEAARAASQAREAARTQLDVAQEAFRVSEKAESDARMVRERARADVSGARTEVARLEAARDRVLDDLDAAVPEPRWRDTWRADPERFHRLQKERAAEYRTRAEAFRGLGDRLQKLAVELDALEAAAAKAADDANREQEGFRRVDDEITRKRSRRAALFGGRPVAEVEADLRAALERASSEMARREAGAGAARTSRAAAESRLTEARRLLKQREGTAAKARAAVDSWLAGHNAARPGEPPLDITALAALLAHDAEWIAAERRGLQALQDAVGHADAVHADRVARRVDIEARRATDETAEGVQDRRDAVGSRLESARSRRAEREAELRLDTERRRRTEQLRADIERQEAVARLWAQMSDLIGSADGKKFRNYAQQLTLDVLVGYANRHLSELTRRYRLRRLADCLGLIVVDHDMADEVRGVHSLSGGESFLVSLALALGLSSLSARRMQVESLFIDEGFGSLDAETLTVAMDALDRLQAQGRKVGVISHVQELAERIGTRIQVEKQAGGQSRVVVTG